MGFGGDDVEFKATLDTSAARQSARELKSDVEKIGGNLGKGLGGATSAVEDLTSAFAKGRGSVAAFAADLGGLTSKLGPLATQAGIVVGVLGGLAYGFKQVLDVAADGDRFGDIAEAFDRNAQAAGALSDQLLGTLAKASLDTVSNLDLMTAANKAFQAGIDPKFFDDLTLAAKRYADATGGDTVTALNQLIGAVQTGRGKILEQVGTLQNGKLVLDAYTDSVYENAKANQNVTDVVDDLKRSLTNTYNDFAKALNESTALREITILLADALTGIATAFAEAGKWAIYFADQIAGQVRKEIEGAISLFYVLKSAASDLGNGELPDLSKGLDEANKALAGFQKRADSTERTIIKLKGSTDKAGKAAKDYKKQLEDSLLKSDVELAKSVGINLYDELLIPSTGENLKARIVQSLKNIRPDDILSALVGTKRAFLDGITGTPQQIKEETQKRLDVFKQLYAEVQKDLQPRETDFEKASASAKGSGASIYGIDASGLSDELASQIQGAVGTALSLASKAITVGVTGADAAAIGSAIGGVIGAAIGTYFGSPEAGAAIGSVAGGIIGQIASQFGEDTAGTKARKSADKFFADMFDADRLSVIVDGQIQRIKDIVFNPDAGGGKNGAFGAAAGATVGLVTGGLASGAASQLGRSGPDSFATGTFDDQFQQQSAQVQNAFNAVGAGFEELLGVSDDIAGQIGAILFNNIGGSLENLQVLVQITGKSFEELATQVVNAFLDGTYSIEEAYGRLQGLQSLFESGIPGAVGATQEAIDNFNIALQDGKGSRILIDSLRDIGSEAGDIGQDLRSVVGQLGQTLGFSAQQTELLFQAMKVAGINSVEELSQASTAKLIALAESIRRIKQDVASTEAGLAAPITDPTADQTAPGLFTDGGPKAPTRSSGGGGGGRSSGQSAAERAADKRKRELEQLRQQVLKTLQTTDEYQKIVDDLNAGLITGKDATKAIREEYDELFSTTKRLKEAQAELEKALANPKSKKNVGELAAEVERLTKKVEELQGKGDKATPFDLSGVTAAIKTLDQLGVVANAVGVTLEKNKNILVQGFLKGRLSISEVNAEIQKTTELLSDGIPNAVGAVDEALSNLKGAGRQGGLFSVDALRDVAAELDELLSSRGSGDRAAKIAQLTAEFDAANAALQGGINAGKTPAELKSLRDQFEGAKKALEDFKASKDVAGFEDLRNELEKTLPEDQVDIFFSALEKNGITSIEGLAKASDDTAVSILGDLDKMGFAFSDVVEPSVQAAIKAFNDAETAAAGGRDVLGAQLDIVRQFNDAVNQLPASFGASVPAIQGLGQPLGELSSNFDELLNKLALLTTPQRGSIVYDVSFNAKDSKSQNLFDLLFGDGEGSGDGTGGPGPGLTAAQKKEFFELRRKNKAGKLTKKEQRRFDELNAIRGA